jgi:tRNA/tmRNA/rRNA uracil-C5-methylase (TrmA/RlmC/RlmD family)
MKTIELLIEKPAYGGCGLGFAEHKAVFVPYAVPGDRVRAVITREKKDYAFASVEEVLSPSALRIEPECPNFAACGGCDHLNMEYAAELDFKKSILTESIARIAKMDRAAIPEPAVIAGPRLRYRSRATLKFGPSGQPGFYRRDTVSVVPFPDSGCLLLSGELMDGIRTVDAAGNPELRAAVDGKGRFFAGGTDAVREAEQGIVYERDPRRFFQSNRFLRGSLLETAAACAGLREGERFLDIGCGVGFFTLYLARGGNRGTGVDIDRESIRWAAHNAKLNNIGTAAFIARDAAALSPREAGADVVVLDPPRAGIRKNTRHIVAESGAARIVYVSCNPATFARDIGHFTECGYRLTKLTMIDMFPATGHIEAVGLLERG